MRKVLVTILVFVGSLATVSSALSTQEGSKNIASTSNTSSTAQSTQAEKTLQNAQNALDSLKVASKSEDKCKAFVKVELYCEEMHKFHDNDILAEADAILEEADAISKVEHLDCKKELKCKERMNSKFFYDDKLHDDSDFDKCCKESHEDHDHEDHDHEDHDHH